mmetsp:Transcript_26204/g.51451  ORF Transcript_26204/g.51451 Transcript_26204/m.51451 type:complete len:104 (+) Transcript_26204:333-644(+)
MHSLHTTSIVLFMRAKEQNRSKKERPKSRQTGQPDSFLIDLLLIHVDSTFSVCEDWQSLRVVMKFIINSPRTSSCGQTFCRCMTVNHAKRPNTLTVCIHGSLH